HRHRRSGRPTGGPAALNRALPRRNVRQRTAEPRDGAYARSTSETKGSIPMTNLFSMLVRLAAPVLVMTSFLAAASAYAQQPRSAGHQMAQRVTFPSLDGKTTLTGYLFLPAVQSGRVPAVVMMHGRAGAYSSRANGVYDATTLSKRHQAWG